jgi:hypothetical protein
MRESSVGVVHIQKETFWFLEDASFVFTIQEIHVLNGVYTGPGV